MAKYIHIEEDHLEEYVNILSGLVVGLNPYLDEAYTKEIMLAFLSENKLTEDAAAELGDLLSHTCVRTKKPLDC